MAKATLAEDTAQAIIQYIIDNHLKPGDKLPTEPVFMEKLMSSTARNEPKERERCSTSIIIPPYFIYPIL